MTHQCTRSHPHENMDEMCELRTEIARLTNELAQVKQYNTDLDAICQDLQEMTYTQAMRIAELEAKLAEEQSTKCVTSVSEVEPVALMVVNGEISYKSTYDDQSFGMWCPVNYDSSHSFPDGTKFYTHPYTGQPKDKNDD